MTLSAGARIDRYVVERLLGEGGGGVVYGAYDPRLDRRVALKLLRRESLGSGADSARLVREARAAAALEHPNAVAVYDVGLADDDTPFLAMELVTGETLRAYVGEDGPPISTRLAWLLDVARVLAAAHARGIIHRDIKPSNVLIREDGIVKVADFGVARRAPRAAHDFAPPSAREAAEGDPSDRIAGTPAYMAPEQFLNEDVDARADQFAWGVVAYELLTGALPWTGSKSDDFATAILTQEAPRLDASVAGAREVDLVIHRALAKDRDARFVSMAELAGAFEQAVRPLVPSVAPPPLPAARRTRSQRPTPTRSTASLPSAPSAPRARRWPVIVAAAAGVAAIGYAIARPPPAPPPARPSSADAAVAPAVAVTDLPLPATASPDALATYRAAMQAYRDGALALAIDRFTKATELDPALAAAQLRVGMTTMQTSASAARDHFEKAVLLRASLDDHDRVLLDAFEPYVRRQPADKAEWTRRLHEATERFPRDAEFALHHAHARFMQGEHELFDRAVALDPKFGLALGYRAETQSYDDDLEGALATAETCLRDVPPAMFCMSRRALIDRELGNCARLERDAQAIMASSPSLDYGYYYLADAIVGLGRPLEAAREAVTIAENTIAEAERPQARVEDSFALHALDGDFVATERDARELERLVAGDSNRSPHAGASRRLVEVLRETGQDDAAARVAADFLRRRDAWTADPRAEDLALTHDATPMMLAALARGGRLTPAGFEDERATWVDAWRSTSPDHLRPFIWLYGYAAVVDRPERAEAALSALPRFTRVPRHVPDAPGAAYAGGAYLRAGRVDDALPYLRIAAASCFAREWPFVHTRGLRDLGDALAQKGDRDGACAAYAAVLRRWGRAHPRSTTADDARSRARALGCRAE